MITHAVNKLLGRSFIVYHFVIVPRIDYAVFLLDRPGEITASFEWTDIIRQLEGENADNLITALS